MAEVESLAISPQRLQVARFSAVSQVISAKKWVITQIWNWVMSFGTGFGYLVPDTIHY